MGGAQILMHIDLLAHFGDPSLWCSDVVDLNPDDECGCSQVSIQDKQVTVESDRPKFLDIAQLKWLLTSRGIEN